MTISIGNGPVSWGITQATRDDEPAWGVILDAIAGAGYAHTELGRVGFYPDAPQALSDALSTRGLTLSAGVVFRPFHDRRERDSILDWTRRLCRLLASQGSPWVVLIDAFDPSRFATAGRTDAAPRLERGDWTAMIDCMADTAAVARDHGLSAVLHPHVGTYVEFADEIDRAMADLGPGHIGLCVDTGHSLFAGVDPAALIDRYPDRVRYLHLKDVDRNRLQRVRDQALDFNAAVRAGVFVPLGRGHVDFIGVKSALDRAGYTGMASVEQDADLDDPGDPSANAAASLAFLRRVGLAA